MRRFGPRGSWGRGPLGRAARAGGPRPQASVDPRKCKVILARAPTGPRTFRSCFAWSAALRPFSTHRPTEIVSAPKVYGFVCYPRGWAELRTQDLGLLWEHYVLNELMAHSQSRQVGYWRDKRQHEVDFVWAPRGVKPLAIECKWSAGEFYAGGLAAFRQHYPLGENVVVARDVDAPFTKTYGNLSVRFEGPASLIARIARRRPA
ncbi:MAG: DUF4143 domain-containing protein [Planctomycetes bacterium]|nr:DUF4143 domain-containing protein [Planctomycetota bacterium]